MSKTPTQESDEWFMNPIVVTAPYSSQAGINIPSGIIYPLGSSGGGDGNNNLEALDDNTRNAIEMSSYFITHNEGSYSYPYLDTNGKVTVGVGNNVDNKEKFLKIRFGYKGKFSSAKEKLEGYNRLKGMEYGPNIPASRFKGVAKLFQTVDDQEADAFVNTINARNDAVSFFGREFVDYPIKIQIAITDLSFQLGYDRLSKFTKLKNSLSKGDYNSAAKEIHIKDTDLNGNKAHGISKRNEEREKLMKEAAEGNNDLKTVPTDYYNQ